MDRAYVQLEGERTVIWIPASGVAFPLIETNNPILTHLRRSITDRRIRSLIARLGNIEASWNISSNDIATRFIEDGLLDAGIGGAERLPVAVGCVERGDVAVAYHKGFQRYLRLLGVEEVLADDLSAQGREVVALRY